MRKVNGGTATVGQYKAYITASGIADLSTSSAPSADFISFDDESTGIKEIQTENGQYTMYNLLGQRVTDNQKGLIIVNGKKVIRK